MHVIITTDTTDAAALAVARQCLRVHHPEATITVADVSPVGTAVGGSIGDTDVLRARAFTVGAHRYSDVHLAAGPQFARWAVLPSLIGAVGSTTPVLVVPATSFVLGPINEVASLRHDELALVPRRFDATTSTASGGWVEGVVAVGSSAAPILDWWNGEAARRFADPTSGPAQVWQTISIHSGALVVWGDPGLRLAPSTASTLHLDGDLTAPRANGSPLRLAQFPAFDPKRPWWYVETSDAEPQALVSENDVLRDLAAAYATQLTTVDVARPSAAPLMPLGVALTPALRAAFHKRLLARNEGDPSVANPYHRDEVADFYDWLRDTNAPITGINVAADLIWQDRPDLSAAFPAARWRQRPDALRWLWTHGLNEGLITTALLPELPERQRRAERVPFGERPFGVNLIGYHDAGLGLGVAIRRTAAALDAAGIAWEPLSYDRTNSHREGTPSYASNAPYRYNLILITPDQLGFFLDDVGHDILEDRYTIGLWYWETDVLSPTQRNAYQWVDEVWGSTKFLAEVFERYTDKPVAYVPVPLEFEVGEGTAAARAALGLDDRFTFLFSFDYLSIAQRKNPEGVIEAYRRAFPEVGSTRLIIKSMNGDLHLDQLEELRHGISDRSDIEVRDTFLPAKQRLDLMAAIDCYVSLHRSEGLGLTMAEAMAAGTPVIATKHSGNLDFMTPESGILIDADIVEIGPGSFYPADGHWADPDLDAAAEAMRSVAADPKMVERMGAAGPAALRPFTVKRVGQRIAERLHGIDHRLIGLEPPR
ncbi:MAG: glycosyltransferase family 4 protein [Actinobacteria bacterium]|nr:glycosyltransferase family 4 protein [Actinomycetota bacterium]